MAGNNFSASTSRPAGYEALVRLYGLDVVPNWHRSFVALSGAHRVTALEGRVEEVYPSKYWPGDSPCGHLEFALKYDGTNLAILSTIFGVMDERELTDHVRSKPTGKNARRLWYLYEFLAGRKLPLDDVKQGNYVDLLDPEEVVTVNPAIPVRRQRVNDNLPGVRQFCPLIRRTETIKFLEASDLAGRCREVVSAYPPEILKRALGYLYTKETRSSFEIERVNPTASRTERFVALLQLAGKEDFCEKERLVDLQNRTVDSRFRDPDYRSSQNYVGETVAWHGERIHYVAPKPEDLAGLMEGLIECHGRMAGGGVHAVIHAAVVAFGFVFLHPFEDGNGRIHRFLIHNILARRGLTPEGMIFPVSASMLKNPQDYDASLEAFSRPLMSLVDYSLDGEGRMTVHNETAAWYRYIDMTPQVEALFRFIGQTIETEMAGELEFLASYDRAKRAIQEIADLPDRKIDLFIRFCLQNNGRLSENKRRDSFAFLSDSEVARMEEAIRMIYPHGVKRDAGKIE